MSRVRFCLLALLAVSIAAPVSAQTGVEGDWNITIQSPQGSNTVKMNLKQDGEKVTGVFKGQQGELPLSGTLTGSDLKLAFSVPFQGQSLEITLTGKVEGQTIAGSADFGGFAQGDFSAKRPEATATAEAATTTSSSTTSTAATTTEAATTTAGAVAGTWEVTLKTPGGDFPATATLLQDGGKVSGKFGSQMGEVEVSGTIDGKALKLSMIAQTPNGPLNVELTGDVDGDAILNGKAEVAGMGQMEWSAKRAPKQ